LGCYNDSGGVDQTSWGDYVDGTNKKRSVDIVGKSTSQRIEAYSKNKWPNFGNEVDESSSGENHLTYQPEEKEDIRFLQKNIVVSL